MATEIFQNSSQVMYSTLDLTHENLLERLQDAFADSVPDVIIYEKENRNLTKLYTDFWAQFYESPGCSGKNTKFPNPSLGNEKIKSLAKIVRSGWEDERFLPTKFFEPFLKSCLFGEQSINSVPPETVLDIIEDEKIIEIIKPLLNGQASFDNECLTTLRVVFPELEEHPTSDQLKQVCIGKVENKLKELDVVIQQWREELNHLMDMKKFDFMLKQRDRCLLRESNLPEENLKSGYNDLDKFQKILPHKLWGTFFLGWMEDEIDFYFKMLRYTSIKCGCGYSGSKHLMGNDGTDCAVKENTFRQAYVLRMIEEELRKAIEEKEEDTMFALADDWFIKTRDSYWLSDRFQEGQGIIEQPHLLTYSVKLKKVFIVEVSVRWEEWYKLLPDERIYKTKTMEYQEVVDQFEKDGFTTVFRDIELGCRGILSRTLYDIFTDDLKMEHRDVSQKMEEISKEIILIYYRKLTDNSSPSKVNLKRKYED